MILVSWLHNLLSWGVRASEYRYSQASPGWSEPLNESAWKYQIKSSEFDQTIRGSKPRSRPLRDYYIVSLVGWLMVNWKGSWRKQSWLIPGTIVAFAMAKSGYYPVRCHSSFQDTSLTFAMAHFTVLSWHLPWLIHSTILAFAMAHSRYYPGICHGPFKVPSCHCPWLIQDTTLGSAIVHSGYYPGICLALF
jgi:hypothetical protein